MLNSIFNFNFTINKIIIILWDFYNYYLSLLSVSLSLSLFYFSYFSHAWGKMQNLSP